MNASQLTKYSIIIVFSLGCLLTSPFLVRQVSATEIAVEENGPESVNEASVSQTVSATVESLNIAAVENDISVTLQTGGNSVSGNSGETEIQTGDISDTTTIDNTLNTTSVDQSGCCSVSGTLVIVSSNGSGSNNTASQKTTNSTNVTVNNNARINNTVNGKASTGNNTANNNSGDVTIKTGSISVKTNIGSTGVNTSRVILPRTISGQIVSDISGNGVGSQNILTFLSGTKTTITTTNYADIFTDVLLNVNTGNNSADGNSGNVLIATGDISVTTDIENTVNANTVTTECECKPEPSPTPTPVDKITPNPTSYDKSNSNGNGSGEVASISSEKILPVTGLNWLVLAFIGNVMMLFLGMILRLRSGNSPGIAAN